MVRVLTIVFALTLGSASWADEIFADYAAYEDYVDGKIKNRDFIPLIKRLGGADEYTDQQLENINRQFLAATSAYMSNVDVPKRIELKNGYAQELRIYWNKQNDYLFYYAFLHDRADGLLVLKFSLNTNSRPILQEF